MPRANLIQTNGTAGELSPRMYGRVDFQNYYNGFKRLRNIYPFPHGGITARAGSRMVYEVKASSRRHRLIGFEFSNIQAYILELGHYTMRFYKDQGIIVNGASPYEIATPWDEDEIWELDFAQSADVMYFTHPDYAPRKLSRTGHTSWTLSVVDWIDGPYLDPEPDTNELDPSGITGSVTLTADSAVFTSDMVGALVRWNDTSGDWYWFKITAYSSSTVVTADVMGEAGLDYGDLADHTKSGPFRIGAWGEHRGWPAKVAFFDQRLILGYTDEDPMKYWGSVTADYENMAPSDSQGNVADTDALSYELADQKANPIQWVCPSRNLVFGTLGGEWVVGSPSLESSLSPNNPQLHRRHSSEGSENQRAELIDRAVVFVRRHGKRMMDYGYDWANEAYNPADLSRLAPHLTKVGLGEFAFQAYPDRLIWLQTDEGDLLTCTYYRDEDVIGWSLHETEGTVESVCVIPGTYQDEVWLVVNRLNGRFVEFIEAQYGEVSDDIEDAFYVDSGLTYHDPADISGATAANPVVVTATAHGFSDGDWVRTSQVEGMTDLNINDYLIGDVATDYFSLFDTDTIAMTGATQADPVVITAPAHGLADGDSVYIEDVAGMTELNGNVYTVANKTDDTFELSGVDGTGFTPYTAGGFLHQSIDGTGFTPYTSDGLAEALATTQLSGLDHLEGQTVAVLADGSPLSQRVVSSGTIAMDYPTAKAQVGLPFTPLAETLPLGKGNPRGDTLGLIQRINSATVQFQDTVGCQVWTSDDDEHPEDLVMRDETSPVDGPLQPMSGFYQVSIEGAYERGTTIIFKQPDPLPLTITSISFDQITEIG